MSDEREAAARSRGRTSGVTRTGQASDRERVLLLECRLEQMRAALDAAREEADAARMETAEVSAREADHARRFAALHEELAEARTRIAALHRELDRSESLREELAGHLFESGNREDAQELIRLRRKVLAEDQRAVRADRTVQRLRARVEELVTSRELLLTRIAEWQQLIRKGEPEAADLSEFLADLRREILDLEHRSVASDAREALLRERLSSAGIDPDGEPAPPEPAVEEAPEVEPVAAPPAAEAVEVEVAGPEPDEPETLEPEQEAGAEAEERTAPTPVRLTVAAPRTEALFAELRDAPSPALQSGLLLRLGRSGDAEAVDGIARWTGSSEPSVRAAAYEALGRLLERSPAALAPHLRTGLADPDARVRRRVVLATATARGLSAHALLDPLREDPDPQVRRVVRQVLRQSSAGAGEAGAAKAEAPEARTSRPLATRPSRTAS